MLTPEPMLTPAQRNEQAVQAASELLRELSRALRCAPVGLTKGSRMRMRDDLAEAEQAIASGRISHDCFPSLRLTFERAHWVECDVNVGWVTEELPGEMRVRARVELNWGSCTRAIGPSAACVALYSDCVAFAGCLQAAASANSRSYVYSCPEPR